MTADDKSLMRSLGEFVGHIWAGVRAAPDGRRTVQVSERTETERRETSRGEVTLRRTIIEEVDLPADDGRARDGQ